MPSKKNRSSNKNPASTMPEPTDDQKELFEKEFLKVGGEHERSLKAFGDQLRELLPNEIARLRRAAVKEGLSQFRVCLDLSIDQWKAGQDAGLVLLHLGACKKSFKKIKPWVDDEEYKKIVWSVATDVQAILNSNGLNKCTVQVCTDDEGDRLSVTNLLENLLQLDNMPDATPSQTRTGLEGKCSTCLDENIKLFALNPCGHCVCLDCAGEFIGKECPTCKQQVYGKQGVFPN